MATLTEQLQKIQDDIIVVLKEQGKPLTQDQLYDHTKLEFMSYIGWSFAIEKLEKRKLIKFVSGDRWQLVKPLVHTQVEQQEVRSKIN